MIPKKYRLKNKKAFDATYKNRKIVSDSMLTLYVGKPKKDLDTPTKFGFVVSKKYHKRAVKRNRIRNENRETILLTEKAGVSFLLAVNKPGLYARVRYGTLQKSY